MTLQEILKNDLKGAMKEKRETVKNTLRVVLGELGRSEKKDHTDDEVVRVMKKLIKSETEVLEKKGETDSEFIRIIESYLPKMATDDEIKAWIGENVDFSKYKNKMQAIGEIMKHFGPEADGNTVKKILAGF